LKSRIKIIANPVLNDLALLAIEESIRLADIKLQDYVDDLKRDREEKGNMKWRTKLKKSK
jgi:hypothetical protein